MNVFRLSRVQYSKDLSGRGAEKTGGRWNSKGMPILYTSESRALCVAEIAVHTPLGVIPKDYRLITLKIPDNLPVTELKVKNLPEDWNIYPHSDSTQTIGDTFLMKGKYAIMKVPSAVIPGDFNYLINPMHPASKLIKITSVVPFAFDKRLFH